MPNQFPVLRVEGSLDRQGEGLFDKMNGIGAHEVIIETPRHEDTLATIEDSTVDTTAGAVTVEALSDVAGRHEDQDDHRREQRGGEEDGNEAAQCVFHDFSVMRSTTLSRAFPSACRTASHALG